MTEIINPQHYRSTNHIQCIDVIEAWELSYHRGNVIKYVLRAGKKSPETEIEDLKKAEWYIQREIARLQSSNAGDAEKPSGSTGGKLAVRVAALGTNCPCSQPDGFAPDI